MGLTPHGRRNLRAGLGGKFRALAPATFAAQDLNTLALGINHGSKVDSMTSAADEENFGIPAG